MIASRLQLARRSFTLDVDLQLPGQGVTALFGPSGCGKTTLLRALAGLERAAGRVALGDAVWQDDAQRRFVPPHQRPLGYVIQEAALFPHLSVQANLDYGRQRAGSAARAFALDAVVALLGIGALMDRRPATLSGGERQRVAIARALATAPRLLLMDEPLAALDAPRKAEILPYLERLHRELALPIVYVTHAMDEVARLADHLVLLEAGRVRAAGPLAELLARPDLPLARQDEAGVVLSARVDQHDPAYGLTRVAFDGGTLWVGETAAAPGEAVRARVLARDVSVARQRPQDTSVLNVLPVVLDSVQADRSTALLRLRLGGPGGDPVWLLARITRRSADALALQPGDALFAQIKGVALM
ncbi:molybdenum ABC transporter ATP-binding protein [Pseudaquabacterium pictum]|uniref:Molybdenum import ATP-binding protein ModC n=1 Tax=Pseudaquabacterium pictum TaxID=2315236 RepID=A0A480AIM4_9BURK|nr:molybdenum ABC transporter ATP-binding protein [Rubrivivax pictus]GCL61589.1 molybdenum import ATP-binding protein ModC [Rubrivivax pictus]